MRTWAIILFFILIPLLFSCSVPMHPTKDFRDESKEDRVYQIASHLKQLLEPQRIPGAPAQHLSFESYITRLFKMSTIQPLMDASYRLPVSLPGSPSINQISPQSLLMISMGNTSKTYRYGTDFSCLQVDGSLIQTDIPLVYVDWADGTTANQIEKAFEPIDEPLAWQKAGIVLLKEPSHAIASVIMQQQPAMIIIPWESQQDQGAFENLLGAKDPKDSAIIPILQVKMNRLKEWVAEDSYQESPPDDTPIRIRRLIKDTHTSMGWSLYLWEQPSNQIPCHFAGWIPGTSAGTNNHEVIVLSVDIPLIGGGVESTSNNPSLYTFSQFLDWVQTYSSSHRFQAYRSVAFFLLNPSTNNSRNSQFPQEDSMHQLRDWFVTGFPAFDIQNVVSIFHINEVMEDWNEAIVQSESYYENWLGEWMNYSREPFPFRFERFPANHPLLPFYQRGIPAFMIRLVNDTVKETASDSPGSRFTGDPLREEPIPEESILCVSDDMDWNREWTVLMHQWHSSIPLFKQKRQAASYRSIQLTDMVNHLTQNDCLPLLEPNRYEQFCHRNASMIYWINPKQPLDRRLVDRIIPKKIRAMVYSLRETYPKLLEEWNRIQAIHPALQILKAGSDLAALQMNGKVGLMVSLPFSKVGFPDSKVSKAIYCYLRKQGVTLIELDQPQALFTPENRLSFKGEFLVRWLNELGYLFDISALSEAQALALADIHPSLPASHLSMMIHFGEHSFLSEDAARILKDAGMLFLLNVPLLEQEPSPSFINLAEYIQYFSIHAFGLVLSEPNSHFSQTRAVRKMLQNWLQKKEPLKDTPTESQAPHGVDPVGSMFAVSVQKRKEIIAQEKAYPLAQQLTIRNWVQWMDNAQGSINPVVWDLVPDPCEINFPSSIPTPMEPQ